MNIPTLAIIIPCLNEEACIDDTTGKLLNILKGLEEEGEISQDSFIFFVSDGSTDNTWNLIEKYNKESQGKVKGIKFSRNFGNQRAILAGLLEASKYNTDCFITMDADLQQDENKLMEFLDKYKNGAKIVCGIRNNRKTDGLFKKISALSFYKLMNLMGVNIKINHSDFRLVSREVVDTLRNFKETNLFLRAMFNELGYKTDYVFFDVKPRKFGKTKFSLVSLISLAVNGITSFSLIPLRLVTFVGFLMAFISFLLGLSAIVDYFFYNDTVSGWTTIVVAIGFICGIQILCLGIIAEYIGQLYMEVKARPRYIIEQEIN